MLSSPPATVRASAASNSSASCLPTFDHGCVCVWTGGQEAGNGLWDVLTGAYNPSARLANTWPASDAQLPPIGEYHMRAGYGRTYQYLDEARAPPLFRFAEGLSYSTTSVSGLTVVGGPSADVCADIKLRVKLQHRTRPCSFRSFCHRRVSISSQLAH